MSVQQTYRDKWMMRERENKEQVERRIYKQSTEASRVGLKLSSFTYNLLLYFMLLMIQHNFSGAEGKHVS